MIYKDRYVFEEPPIFHFVLVNILCQSFMCFEVSIQVHENDWYCICVWLCHKIYVSCKMYVSRSYRMQVKWQNGKVALMFFYQLRLWENPCSHPLYFPLLISMQFLSRNYASREGVEHQQGEGSPDIVLQWDNWLSKHMIFNAIKSQLRFVQKPLFALQRHLTINSGPYY